MSWGAYRLHFPVDEPVVFVDVETTGLSAASAEIIEIAAILVHPGNDRHKAIECLVRPSRAIPRHITALTGITQDMVDQDGFEIADAIGHFLELVNGYPIVAYNVSFDASFLRPHCVRHARFHSLGGHACALRLARMAWPQLGSHKLSAVAAHLGLPDAGPHRALADVKRCLQVYYRALGVTTTTPVEFR